MSHICIVVSRFYEDIADELLTGAVVELKGSGVTYEIVEVPGTFEIPAAVSMAMHSGRYVGYVALGCVIRGETTHYDYVCTESARGLNDLAVHHRAPVGYGILTVENRDQAWVRADRKQGNKGRDAVQACLRMIAVRQKMVAE